MCVWLWHGMTGIESSAAAVTVTASDSPAADQPDSGVVRYKLPYVESTRLFLIISCTSAKHFFCVFSVNIS